MAEPTEPIPSGTNGSHADTVTERESLAYRSIIKECLKFNGKYAEGMVHTIKYFLISNLVCHLITVKKEDLKY